MARHALTEGGIGKGRADLMPIALTDAFMLSVPGQ